MVHRVAVVLVQERQGVGVGHQLDGPAGGRGEVEDGAGGDAAAPEERVDLVVLEGVNRLRGPEALLPDVGVRVEADRLEHAQGGDLGAAARRPRRHDAVAQVGDGLDALALEGHELVQVVVEHREGPRRHRAEVGERPPPLRRVVERVGEDERQVGAPVRDELQVVDGPRGDLGRRLHPLEVVADDLGDAAAVGVVDAPGAAGGDREPFGEAPRRPAGCRRPRRRRRRRPARPACATRIGTRSSSGSSSQWHPQPGNSPPNATAMSRRGLRLPPNQPPDVCGAPRCGRPAAGRRAPILAAGGRAPRDDRRVTKVQPG